MWDLNAIHSIGRWAFQRTRGNYCEILDEFSDRYSPGHHQFAPVVSSFCSFLFLQGPQALASGYLPENKQRDRSLVILQVMYQKKKHMKNEKRYRHYYACSSMQTVSFG